MSNFPAINKRGLKDVAFVGGLNGKSIGVWAQSLAEAKQRVVEHFKPKKKDKGLVWVERAVEDETDPEPGEE